LLTVAPIGHVVGGRVEPVDDDWDAVTATIRLDATRFNADALRGLDAFYLEVLYTGPRPQARDARVPPAR